MKFSDIDQNLCVGLIVLMIFIVICTIIVMLIKLTKIMLIMIGAVALMYIIGYTVRRNKWFGFS